MMKTSESKMSQKEILRFDELKNLVYDSDNPLAMPNDVLAELWKLEYKYQKSLTRGQMNRENRMHQFSFIVNTLNTVTEDCKEIAKTKLNIHRTECLALADDFSNICQDLRVKIIKFQHIAGWWKNIK